MFETHLVVGHIFLLCVNAPSLSQDMNLTAFGLLEFIINLATWFSPIIL